MRSDANILKREKHFFPSPLLSEESQASTRVEDKLKCDLLSTVPSRLVKRCIWGQRGGRAGGRPGQQRMRKREPRNIRTEKKSTLAEEKEAGLVLRIQGASPKELKILSHAHQRG